MVALNGGSLAACLASATFNNVRINSSLSQELHTVQILCNSKEFFPELGTNNLALLFRISNAIKQLCIALFGVYVNKVNVKLLGEYLFNLFRLILAKQAVINEHANQLLANRLGAQGCNYRRINAARKTKDYTIIANLFTNCSNGVFNNRIHSPSRLQIADVEQEVGKHLVAVFGVLNFGVELSGVEFTLGAFHGSYRAYIGRRSYYETFRNFAYGIAMAHPYRLLCWGVTKQSGSARAVCCITARQWGRAVLAFFGVTNGAAKRGCHNLLTIAKTQNGNAQFKHARINRRSIFSVHTCRTAAQN